MGMIGERVVRTEDPALVTGHATYVDNLTVDGAVHVVYVRSAMAHARIVDIDVSEATSMPGVLAVFTIDDLKADGLGPIPIDMPMLPSDVRRTALADGVVRFVGEIVAAVVAETRAEAADAVEAVVVDYEPLEAVVDPEVAMDSSTLLFPHH